MPYVWWFKRRRDTTACTINYEMILNQQMLWTEAIPSPWVVEDLLTQNTD